MANRVNYEPRSNNYGELSGSASGYATRDMKPENGTPQQGTQYTNGSKSIDFRNHTLTARGTNSQGNYYDAREYADTPHKGYHYSNQDGSYYYSNPDGSAYFDDGKGGARYTREDGSGWENQAFAARVGGERPCNSPSGGQRPASALSGVTVMENEEPVFTPPGSSYAESSTEWETQTEVGPVSTPPSSSYAGSSAGWEMQTQRTASTSRYGPDYTPPSSSYTHSSAGWKALTQRTPSVSSCGPYDDASMGGLRYVARKPPPASMGTSSAQYVGYGAGDHVARDQGYTGVGYDEDWRDWWGGARQVW
ncbi:hypothetical protein LTR08_002359 [Meristemomyces frigidus]|nr:hypothetical protein LTR08_002359 [Meristemomyces frigidus]